jgi:hypothetical protein
MTSPTPEQPRNHERLWPAAIALFTCLLTLIPYLIGWSFADGRRFMWLGYNLDDSCVYLSWMRQAADGSLRAYNLFTTEPQNGMALNPLFLLLGNVARVTSLPLLAVYHSARLAFGFGLLLVIWKLIAYTISDQNARRLAFLCVCFSAGLGWLPLFWTDPPLHTPIDKWQPEAITFLSLYLSPLFCVSLALQVAVVWLLLIGLERRDNRWAFGAGLCGLLLSLVHTYDVITLAVVWIGYLLTSVLTSRAAPEVRPANIKAGLFQTLITGAITLPGVLYIFNEYRTEQVFRARANVETLSAPLPWVILGYGLTLLLALLAIYSLVKSQQEADERSVILSQHSNLFFPVWAVLNIAVSYAPGVPFQRKMLQGAHIPIAILAGVGVGWLLRQHPLLLRRYFAPVAIVLSLLLGVTNLRFVLRDIENYQNNLSQTKQQRPYLEPGEIAALEWIRANTPADTAIQPLPWILVVTQPDGRRQIGTSDASLACFAPGLIGRKVYCGHWGETPAYPEKLSELRTFGLPRTTDPERIALLRRMKVRYLIFSQKKEGDESADQLLPMFRRRLPLPGYLIPVYSNPDADIYEVRLPPESVSNP